MKKEAKGKGLPALRNKYLPAIITALFFLLSFTTTAQVYQNDPAYGRRINRYAVDTTLIIPTVCGVPTLRSTVTNKAAIAYDSCNAKFYIYDPATTTWGEITGGGSGGSGISEVIAGSGLENVNDSTIKLADSVRTNLGYRFAQKMDSAVRINDSTIRYYKDGVTWDIAAAIQHTTIFKSPILVRTAAETGADNDSIKIKYGDSILIYAHLTGSNLVLERMDGDSVVIALPGGSGSGITELGTPAYGLTRTNDSTYIVDTTVISSKTYSQTYYNDVAGVSGGFEIIRGNGSADTILTGGGTDTTSLSDRINLKLNISDTASMLSPYLRSALAAATYLDKTASQTAWFIYGNHTSGSAAPTFAKMNINSIDATGTPSSSTYLRGDGSWTGGIVSQWTTTGSDIYYNTGKVGIGNTGPIALLDVKNSFAASAIDSSKGINLENTRSATNGSQSPSPYINFKGQVYASTPAVSIPYYWQENIIGTQGTTAASVITGIQWLSSVNNSAPVQRMLLSNDGSLSIFGTITSTSLINSSNRINAREFNSNANHIIGFSYGLTHTNTGSGNIDYFLCNPTLNASGGSTNVRGFYFNPTNTNVSGFLAVNAFQNTSGNNLFGTTSGSTGIGANTSIAASAILDITSTAKGVLFPRMTTTQRDAISSPATGLQVYNTTTNTTDFYNGTGWLPKTDQQSRVSTQYDNTTTTLGNITGLTADVAAGKTYRFEARLYTTSNVAGGIKAAIAGTATATNIIYEGLTTDAGLTTQGRGTALATAVGGVTAVTAAYVVITGTITVNAAGTLTVQAAANAATGTTSVLVGSTFLVSQIL